VIEIPWADSVYSQETRIFWHPKPKLTLRNPQTSHSCPSLFGTSGVIYRPHTLFARIMKSRALHIKLYDRFLFCQWPNPWLSPTDRHFLLSAIVCSWLDFCLLPRCPQVLWCYWGKIEPFAATLAQDKLAEYDQPGRNPLEYSAVVGNWTRATGRTDSELSHWAIMTDKYGTFIQITSCIILATQWVAWRAAG